MRRVQNQRGAAVHELNVNEHSSFLIRVGNLNFLVDVVDIVQHDGDTTEYHLQNLNHDYSRMFTAHELSTATQSGALTLL